MSIEDRRSCRQFTRLLGWCPVPRGQVVKLAHRMISDASKHVGKRSHGIDVVEFGCPRMDQVSASPNRARDQFFNRGRLVNANMFEAKGTAVDIGPLLANPEQGALAKAICP